MSEMVVKSASITRKPRAFDKRIHEIDLIRGFLIILVIMDHLFWCFKSYNYSWYVASGYQNGFFEGMYKVFNFYWTSTAREVVRVFALFGFCFVSGVSSAFSKNNWIRAAEMLVVFAIVAVGSNLLDASPLLNRQVTRIDFNVIGVLAWSTLFYCFTQNKTWRSILIGLLLSFLICWYVIPWLEKTPLRGAYAPPLWAPEGQADYMPLFPYMTFFFMGALFSYFVYAPTRQSIVKVKGDWERPICFLGRHTLIIYLGHQFILTPLFLLLNVFFG